MNDIVDAFRMIVTGSNWSGPDGFGALAAQQVLQTLTAMVIASVIGLPIALWLGHLGKGGFLAINVSNIGRAIPVYAVLLLLALGPVHSKTFGPYGRAGLATLIALVLFALPPIITNAYVGMREVDRDLVEAANGMGMKGRQVFRSIEVPLAMPVILTGLRIALVQIWATATIAALVAGPGLGSVITDGFYNQRTPEVLAGAILVAVGALLLEGFAVLTQRWLDPMRTANIES